MTGKSCFHAGRIALAMIAHPLHPDPSFLPIFSPWRSTVTKFADNQRENERRFHEFPAISNDRKAVDVGSRSRFPRFVVALSLLFYSSLKEKKGKELGGGQWKMGSGLLEIFFSFFFYCSFYLKILLRVFFRLEILALRSKWCLKDSISAHRSGYTLSDRFSGQSVVNEWSVDG